MVQRCFAKNGESHGKNIKNDMETGIIACFRHEGFLKLYRGTILGSSSKGFKYVGVYFGVPRTYGDHQNPTFSPSEKWSGPVGLRAS